MAKDRTFSRWESETPNTNYQGQIDKVNYTTFRHPQMVSACNAISITEPFLPIIAAKIVNLPIYKTVGFLPLFISEFSQENLTSHNRFLDKTCSWIILRHNFAEQKSYRSSTVLLLIKFENSTPSIHVLG